MVVRENVVPRTGRARFAQHDWTFNVSANYSIILAGFALDIYDNLCSPSGAAIIYIQLVAC